MVEIDLKGHESQRVEDWSAADRLRSVTSTACPWRPTPRNTVMRMTTSTRARWTTHVSSPSSESLFEVRSRGKRANVGF